MKNAIKIIALALVLVMTVATLVACNPSGKYVAEDGVSFVEFDGDTIKMGAGEYALEGTYEIDGDKIKITIAGVTQELDYEKDGKTVTIDGEKFTKE